MKLRNFTDMFSPTFDTIISTIDLLISTETASDDKEGEGGCSVDECTVGIFVVAAEPRPAPMSGLF